MPAPAQPARLASIFRGSALETVVRGNVVVADADGTVLAAAGNPAAPTTVRSCVKPIQAQPFVEYAVDRLGLTDAELAIACASHAGEPRHVDTVTGLLARAHLDETALTCGPQLPFDEHSARHLLASGRSPSALTNNCSGKHAAMAATCVVMGWPVDGYSHPSHPLQVEIRSRMSAWSGVSLDEAPSGVDGCGLRTHEMPLVNLARAFAAGDRDAGFRRCEDAMAAHPHLVAGRHRLDTDLLAAAGGRLTCKTGGAAVWVAVLRGGGRALALKLEAGDPAAMGPVALAALVGAGFLEETALSAPALVAQREGSITNWAGDTVGGVHVEAGWVAGLRG